jgi:hypothetical protein
MLWCFSAARVSGGKAALLAAPAAADPPHLSRPPTLLLLSKPKNNTGQHLLCSLPPITVQKILLSWSLLATCCTYSILIVFVSVIGKYWLK